MSSPEPLPALRRIVTGHSSTHEGKGTVHSDTLIPGEVIDGLGSLIPLLTHGFYDAYRLAHFQDSILAQSGLLTMCHRTILTTGMPSRYNPAGGGKY